MTGYPVALQKSFVFVSTSSLSFFFIHFPFDILCSERM
nr:MAG TPA: hypothetical protein [Caudoviricetes sp.]